MKSLALISLIGLVSSSFLVSCGKANTSQTSHAETKSACPFSGLFRSNNVDRFAETLDAKHLKMAQEIVQLGGERAKLEAEYTETAITRSVHTLGQARRGVFYVNKDIPADSYVYELAQGISQGQERAYVLARESSGTPQLNGRLPSKTEPTTSGLSFAVLADDARGGIHRNVFTLLTGENFAMPDLSHYVIFSDDLLNKGIPLKGFFPSVNPLSWRPLYLVQFLMGVLGRKDNRLDETYYSQTIYKTKTSPNTDPLFVQYRVKSIKTDKDAHYKTFSLDFRQVGPGKDLLGGEDRTNYIKLTDWEESGRLVILDKGVKSLKLEEARFHTSDSEVLETRGLINLTRDLVYQAGQDMRKAPYPEMESVADLIEENQIENPYHKGHGPDSDSKTQSAACQVDPAELMDKANNTDDKEEADAMVAQALNYYFDCM